MNLRTGIVLGSLVALLAVGFAATQSTPEGARVTWWPTASAS